MPLILSSKLNTSITKLDWTLQDVLPDELLDNDALQDKTKIPILRGMSAKAALNSLIEEGYLDNGLDRYEIAETCNTYYEEDEKKKVGDFGPALEDLYNQKRLIKIEPDKEKGEKRLKFQKNPDYDAEG